MAVGLVVLYAVYVRAHFTDPAEEGDAGDLNQLHLPPADRLPVRMVDIDVLPGEADRRGRVPRVRIIVTQVVGALALIIVGAQVFVGAVEHLSSVIGLDPRILALVIAPIATELPEKFNSVIWVRSGKDTLAMGNISGAMVFQSCLPTVLGILFTEWTFKASSALAFASAGAAFVSTVLIFGLMLRRGRLSAWSLLIGGPIYLRLRGRGAAAARRGGRPALTRSKPGEPKRRLGAPYTGRADRPALSRPRARLLRRLRC